MKTTSWIALACFLSAVQAMGPSAPPERPAGRPAKMEDFKWADPWAQRKMKRFTPTCEAEDTFDAHEFLLDDLSEAPPQGLKPYSSALKKIFKGRPYPGSWNGIDPHGYDRNLLLMEYADVPVKVREWIEDQEIQDGPGKGLFAVYNKPASDDEEVVDTVAFSKPVETALRPLDAKKVVIFAPGAVYDILPLWVAQDSPCPDALSDISKYSPKLADGAVVAWPTAFTQAAREKGDRNIEFTIKAQILGRLEETATENEVKEEAKDEL